MLNKRAATSSTYGMTIVLLLLALVFTTVATAEAQPVKDGTLIIAYPSNPETLDPQATTSLNSQRAREPLFDTLIDVDHDMNIVASLAHSWDISEDGLTYTFHLRDDVRFHSGKPLVSSDVAYTFERWREPGAGRPAAYLIEAVDRIETPDDYTVVLHLNRVDVDMLYNLAKSDASILNAEFTEAAGDDFGTRLVDGTGPFKVKEWLPRQHLVLERNDDYRWAPANYENRGPAHLKEVIYKFIPEESTRLLELEVGGVHIVQPRISFHEVDALLTAGRHNVIEYPVGSTVDISFNLTMWPMDDITVRKAISHAINTREIIDVVMYGHAIPAEGKVAPHIPGACPECVDYHAEFNPDLARQTLADDGWELGADGVWVKDGRRLVVPAHAYSVLAPYPDSYQVIQAQLADVGIELDLHLLELPVVFDMFRRAENGMWSSSAPHDTAYQALNPRFHSRNAPTPNRYNLNDPRIDELIDRAAVTLDDDERARLFREVQKLALQQYVYVPWFHDKGLVAVRQEVKNWRPYSLANSVFHKMVDVWVEE